MAAPIENPPSAPPRPVVVLGLLPAGLALVRALGRAGIPVHGAAFRGNEFGLRSRYLRSRSVATDADLEARDEHVLDFVRGVAGGGRVVLVPERDEHVEFVLRRWDLVQEVADVPLPSDPEAVRRLRRKDVLPLVAAEAGVAAPTTFPAHELEALRLIEPPFLLKPVEGQEYAHQFGHKAAIVDDPESAVTVWREAREAGFEMIVQELIPDSHENVYSLFTYVGRDGDALANVVGRKVRQGPLRFGTSAVFEVSYDAEVLELGLRLLSSVGYRGFAQVELALDQRDRMFKVLEVNTRLPVWAGIAMNSSFDIARTAYDDLCGLPVAAAESLRESLAWIYLAKDLWVSAQMARRRELSVREFFAHRVRGKKVRAVFAADDPLPAIASVGYLRSRLG